jgi:hypothetical protein
LIAEVPKKKKPRIERGFFVCAERLKIRQRERG